MANSNGSATKSKPSASKREYPAKAGKRKIYVTGRPKTKSFEPKPCYQMPDRFRGDGDVMFKHVEPPAIWVNMRIEQVNRIERNTPKHTLTGPFVFARMRAHVRAGIDPLAG